MKSKAYDEPKNMLRGIIYITLLYCTSFLKITGEKLFRDFPILLVKTSQQHICYVLSNEQTLLISINIFNDEWKQVSSQRIYFYLTEEILVS